MKKFFIILFVSIAATVMGGCLNLEGILPFLNKPPVIISEPIITATENNQYSYQLEVNDPEGDSLTYYLVLSPNGMNINGENGLIIWTPTNDQVGIYQVIIEISDGKQSVTQGFEIEVINVNNPPKIISYFPVNLNFEINEGDSVKFEIQAHDIDLNTTLSYQWFLNGELVLNSSSTEGTGANSTSSWFYSAGYGDYSQKIVKILVNDGELEDYVQWNITINDITPPAQLTLNTVNSPTNISPQILSGTKEADTSIWINGTEAVSLDSSVNWSYYYNLTEGINNISITSRDTVGNESSAITATIEYDPNIYVNAGNTTGTENGTKTHPFNTITEGLIAVTSGKSVVVSAGTYNEQLIINKSITLQGAEKESTIISGLEYTGNLITIEADGVKISGFKIDGISATDVGIYSDSSSSIEISENIIQNQQDSGILYHSVGTGNDYSSGIHVYNNEIYSNSENGIKVIGEGYGVIESNTIKKNTNGIRTRNSASLEIKHNNINDNTSAGILCQDNSSLVIWGNEITINDYGIKVGVLISDTTNPDIGGGTKDGVGQNKIAGNKTHGVSNKTTHNVYAKYNWWGDTAGPKYPGNNSSSGDWAYWGETDGDIIFNPHLTAEP